MLTGTHDAAPRPLLGRFDAFEIAGKILRVVAGAAVPVVLAACISPGSNSPIDAAGEPGSRFPGVVGINLNGQEIALPAGFAGRRNLVAVAFEREQQAAVDTWIEVADQRLGHRQDLRFYEVPVIYEGSAVFRWWVNNGMRSGIPDPDARARTITIYVDRAAFLEALDIPDMDRIQLLLLDDAGQVLWRASGPASEAHVRALERRLAGDGD